MATSLCDVHTPCSERTFSVAAARRAWKRLPRELRQYCVRHQRSSASWRYFCFHWALETDSSLNQLEVGHSIECITHAGRAAPSHRTARLSRRDVLHFWPSDLDLWPFDLIPIGGRGIVMDYLCAKFGDFNFSRFDFIVRTDTRHRRQNPGRQINAILTRLPSASPTM